MKIAKQFVFIALALSAGGCAATKLDNSPQDIAVNVMPAMANCEAFQTGMLVGRYDPTRRAITVPKSLGRTDIVCAAPGFKDKRVSVAPGDSAMGYRRYLTDFGFVQALPYPATVDIALEPVDQKGRPS